MAQENRESPRTVWLNQTRIVLSDLAISHKVLETVSIVNQTWGQALYPLASNLPNREVARRCQIHHYLDLFSVGVCRLKGLTEADRAESICILTDKKDINLVTILKGQTVVILWETLTSVNNITRKHNKHCSEDVENRKEVTAKIVSENKGSVDVDTNNNE